MAQPVFYQTLNMEGVDPSVYYTNLPTAGGSVTPEYPAPPFTVGTRAFGSDGSEFIFVQCNTSTAINLGDFVMLTTGPGVANNTTPTLQANSASQTNVYSSLAQGFGATGLVLRQSVTTIPTGSFFWACVKGYGVPAITSNGLTTSAGAATSSAVYLYVGATAGTMTSVISSLSPAFQGIVCVNSLTTGISASVIPPTGTLLNGLTQGPVVNIYGPRTLVTGQTLGVGAAGASGGALAAF